MANPIDVVLLPPPPDFDLVIQKISPEVVLEKDDFVVTFTLANNTDQQLRGTVAQVINGQPAQGQDIQALDLPPKRQGSGRMKFKATGLGFQVFELGFWKEHTPGEFPPPDNSDHWNLFVGTKVYVGMEQVFILNTRSLHEDTDFASIGATHNGATYGPNTIKLGNVNNGPQNFDIKVGPIPVYPNEDELVIAYTVINQGYDGTAAVGEVILDTVSTATMIALDIAYPPYAGIWAAGNAITAALNHLFAANCDGVVAGDKIAVPVNTLLQALNSSARYAESQARAYHYNVPAPGCNPSGSEYTIRWYVEKAT